MEVKRGETRLETLERAFLIQARWPAFSVDDVVRAMGALGRSDAGPVEAVLSAASQTGQDPEVVARELANHHRALFGGADREARGSARMLGCAVLVALAAVLTALVIGLLSAA